jgi:hypothetical protein
MYVGVKTQARAIAQPAVFSRYRFRGLSPGVSATTDRICCSTGISVPNDFRKERRDARHAARG